MSKPDELSLKNTGIQAIKSSLRIPARPPRADANAPETTCPSVRPEDFGAIGDSNRVVPMELVGHYHADTRAVERLLADILTELQAIRHEIAPGVVVPPPSKSRAITISNTGILGSTIPDRT